MMQANDLENQAAYHRHFCEVLTGWEEIWKTALDFVGSEEDVMKLALDQVGHFGPRGVTLVAKCLVESSDGSLNRVVELGSGFGGAIRQIGHELNACKIYPSLIGIELVPDHCELAAMIGRSMGSREPLLLHADACNTPLPSMDADAIFVTGSASHFSRTDLVLEECHRLLRPGGLLVMTEEVSLRPLGTPEPSDIFLQNHPAQVFFTASPEERRAEIVAAGLKLEAFKPLVDWAGPLLRQRVQMLRLFGHCAKEIFGLAVFEQMISTLTSAADEYDRGSILPAVIVARRVG